MGHESSSERMEELIRSSAGDVAVPPPLAGDSVTPVVSLGRHGSCDVLAKREDLLDQLRLGFKLRKVRWVFARAQADGVTDVILDGVDDSGCLAAAASLGGAFSLRVHVIVRGERPERPTGRLLQTMETATSVAFVDPSGPADEAKALKAAEIRSAGGTPRVLPVGLSTAESLWAGIELAAEIAAYEESAGSAFDALIVAVGTGGTVLSLEVARVLLGRPWQVVGVCIDDDAPADYAAGFAQLCESAKAWFPRSLSGIEGPQLVTLSDHRGYRIPSSSANREAQAIARRYGLEFDETYVAKAWAGGLEWLADHPEIGRALFVVTGGGSDG
jgi:D-cysteine desulfhydrase